MEKWSGLSDISNPSNSKTFTGLLCLIRITNAEQAIKIMFREHIAETAGSKNSIP